MKNLAPLCNLLLTIMLSVWTVLLWNPLPLAALLALELILIGYAGQAGKLAKPIFGLTLVAGFFAVSSCELISMAATNPKPAKAMQFKVTISTNDALI